MKILFIDLETTGLPKQPTYDVYFSYKLLEKYATSRIVQIAALVYDVNTPDEKTAEFKLLAEHNYIIKPNGFRIVNEHIHHIDHSMAEFSGITMKDCLDMMIADIADCKILIAHNVGFDRSVLLSELFRCGLHEYVDVILAMRPFCTSRGCANITRIPFNARKFKQPKLIELYRFLFRKNPDVELHDALADTRVMVDCFIELVNRGLIRLDRLVG